MYTMTTCFPLLYIEERDIHTDTNGVYIKNSLSRTRPGKIDSGDGWSALGHGVICIYSRWQHWLLLSRHGHSQSMAQERIGQVARGYNGCNNTVL